MQTRKHHVRPRSKRDPSLPYTYEAWVDVLEGQGRQPIYDHYFSDTLCGLIECLEEADVEPGHARLTGLFRGEQTKLDTALCTDRDGNWLRRPHLCRVLEEHYTLTHEDCYRGHVDEGNCEFEDRDRTAAGPLW